MTLHVEDYMDIMHMDVVESQTLKKYSDTGCITLYKYIKTFLEFMNQFQVESLRMVIKTFRHLNSPLDRG